jgi:hypothetical protein
MVVSSVMITPIRRQLSLFVPSPHLAVLDAIRRILDPVQHRLIPAHVTACRNDEIQGVRAGQLDHSLEASAPITLSFGRAVPFDGHGILLPCIAGEEVFAAFRAQLLGTSKIRRQAPHITIAHPRNPKAERNDLARALELPAKIGITFRELCLIEQSRGEEWRVLRRYPLD